MFQQKVDCEFHQQVDLLQEQVDGFSPSNFATLQECRVKSFDLNFQLKRYAKELQRLSKEDFDLRMKRLGSSEDDLSTSLRNLLNSQVRTTYGLAEIQLEQIFLKLVILDHKISEMEESSGKPKTGAKLEPHTARLVCAKARATNLGGSGEESLEPHAKWFDKTASDFSPSNVPVGASGAKDTYHEVKGVGIGDEAGKVSKYGLWLGSVGPRKEADGEFTKAKLLPHQGSENPHKLVDDKEIGSDLALDEDAKMDAIAGGGRVESSRLHGRLVARCGQVGKILPRGKINIPEGINIGTARIVQDDQGVGLKLKLGGFISCYGKYFMCLVKVLNDIKTLRREGSKLSDRMLWLLGFIQSDASEIFFGNSTKHTKVPKHKPWFVGILRHCFMLCSLLAIASWSNGVSASKIDSTGTKIPSSTSKKSDSRKARKWVGFGMEDLKEIREEDAHFMEENVAQETAYGAAEGNGGSSGVFVSAPGGPENSEPWFGPSPGDYDNDIVAAPGKNELAQVNKDSFSFGRGTKQLNEISRSLRGNKNGNIDAAGTLTKVKDIIKPWIATLQSVQKHYGEGNKEKAGAILKATVGDEGLHLEEIKNEYNSNDIKFPKAFGGMTSDVSFPNLEDIPDWQVAEFIQPNLLNQMVEHGQDLVKGIEDMDPSMFSPPERDTMKENDQKFDFKFDSNEFARSGFGSQSSFNDPNGRFSGNNFPMHYTSFEDVLHQHRTGLNGGLSKMGRLGSFFSNDAAVMAKHKIRQDALGDTCATQCQPDDWPCNCKKLFGCASKMTRYDLATMIASGYIDKQPGSANFGNFSVPVNSLSLFDADEGVGDKLARIRSLTMAYASQNSTRSNYTLAQCTRVLDEMITACDPSRETCSNPNVESFQLSTEQVCDAVDTSIKLLFEVIGDEFDGFVDKSAERKCEPLSFQACRDFVFEFDRFYQGRNASKHPLDNPMRNDAGKSLHSPNMTTEEIFHHVIFPTEYFYDKNEKGVSERTFGATSSTQKTFLIVNPKTGRALGLRGVGCGKYHGAQDDQYGPLVEVQKYNATDVRQRFFLNDEDEFESAECPGKVITSVLRDDTCKNGVDLAIRGRFRGSYYRRIGWQQWRFKLDMSMRNVACPDLAISFFDDEATKVTDFDYYRHFTLSFANLDTGKVLGVASGACDAMSNLEVQDPTSGDGQLFTLEKVDGDAFKIFSVGCPGARIVSNISNSCADGAQVQVQPSFDTIRELKNAMKACANTQKQSTNACTAIKDKYGWPMNSWNVGQIIDMGGLVAHGWDQTLASSFNEDLSGWDTSRVTSMSFMLYGAESFNGDVSGWDTSNVKVMRRMFAGASLFNGDISSWDTSKVTWMDDMFSDDGHFNGSAFNGDISSWDTSKVIEMSGMFRSSRAFNQDVSGWDTSRVTTMAHMFRGASSFNGDVSGWNTSRVEDMRDMFRGASAFNGDVSSWDTSSVVEMRETFELASVFNGDVSNWDTSKVTEMSSMFENARAFNQDVSGWDTSRVTSMFQMFDQASAFNGDVSNWDTSNVRNMRVMFRQSRAFNVDVSNWNIRKVTDMNSMFQDAAAFDQDLCKWGRGTFPWDMCVWMFTRSGCADQGNPSSANKGPLCRSCSSTQPSQTASLAKNEQLGVDRDILSATELAHHGPKLEADLLLESNAKERANTWNQWRFNKNGTIHNVDCDGKQVVMGFASNNNNDILQVTGRIGGHQKWKAVPSPRATLLPADDIRSQVWKAQFVDPPYQYTPVPGFPGAVETVDAKQCLKSTADPDLAKLAMRTCDKAMNLLVGKQMSLGTLKSLADLVNDHGPEHLPGKCCFDTPTTEGGNFGLHYERSMDCQMPGPFHLSISKDACGNAGGRWFRAPCVTLKKCIDNRPSRFDLDNPVYGQCQDYQNTFERLDTAFVSSSTSHADFPFGADRDGCLQFCQSLPEYSSQVGMMIEGSAASATKCICLYNDGMLPAKERLPSYSASSPPPFSLISPNNGTALGLSPRSNCESGQLKVELQKHNSSPRQKFQLTYDGRIASVFCPKQVLSVNENICTSGPFLRSMEATLVATASTTSRTWGPRGQRWNFNNNGTISNVGCPELAISSMKKSDATLNSFYFALENPITQLAIGIVGFSESCRNEMEIQVQELVYGDPGQQFMKDEKKIVSVLCPELAVEIPGDGCSDAVQLRLSRIGDATNDGRNEWSFHDDGSAIESVKCSGMFISIHGTSNAGVRNMAFQSNPFLSSAGMPDAPESNNDTFYNETNFNVTNYNQTNEPEQLVWDDNIPPMAGSSISLSNKLGQFERWTKKHQQFHTLMGPFSLVDIYQVTYGVHMAIGAGGNGVCAHGMALELQNDNASSIHQQFYLGKHGSIFSSACPGLVITALGSENDYSANSDHSIVLQTFKLNDNSMKWKFNERERTFRSVEYPGKYVASKGFGQRPFLIVLSGWTMHLFERTNIRLLQLGHDNSTGWKQRWKTVFSVPDTDQSLLEQFGSSDDSNQILCYKPNPAFSPSFDDFANGIVIKSASDEDQCKHAREELGFDKHHPFDVDVCDSFKDHMCDSTFTGVDHIAEPLEKPPRFELVEYEEAEYEAVEYKEQNYEEAPKFKTVDYMEFSADNDAAFEDSEIKDYRGKGAEEKYYKEKPDASGLADTELWWMISKHTKVAAEHMYQWAIDSSVAICKGLGPDNLCAGIACVLNPAKWACNAGIWWTTITAYGILLGATIYNQVMEHRYEDKTLGPDSAVHSVFWAEQAYMRTEDIYEHNHNAFKIIQKDMKTQHEQMRGHLQKRHKEIANHIGEYVANTQNSLGQAIVSAQNSLGKVIVNAQNANGKSVVEAQNALGEYIVDAQNANGQAIVEAQNAITTQHNVLGEWLHGSLCLIHTSNGGTCERFIGPLEEDQAYIPMELHWPEGQLNMAERLHQIELLGESMKGEMKQLQESLTGKAADNGNSVLERRYANAIGLRDISEDNPASKQLKSDVGKVDAVESKLTAVMDAFEESGDNTSKEVKAVKDAFEEKMDEFDGKMDEFEGKLDAVVGAVEDIKEMMLLLIDQKND